MVLVSRHHPASVSDVNERTHITLQLWTLPAEVLQQPTLLRVIAHEGSQILLEERREVLGREVVEELNQQQKGLRQQRQGGIWRKGLGGG